MKIEYGKYCIRIIPENEQDQVYLESVLGLFKKGDKAIAERIAVSGIDTAWAYVAVKKETP